MKLLLDECTPARLRFNFLGHDTCTVEQAGLKGLKNGELLQAAESAFDVLITIDQNLRFQQNLSDLSLAIVVLAPNQTDTSN